MGDDERESAPPQDLSFSESLEEIESIVQRIEAEDVDIDELAEELQKAAGLLEVCRAKIRKAELEVKHIVDKLEESEAPDPSSGSGRAGG